MPLIKQRRVKSPAKPTIKESTDRPSTTTTDEDWFTVKVKVPYFCEGCERDWHFPHVAGRILVWPEKDDPAILKCAQEMKVDKLDPSIVKYEKPMGPCISWYRVQP